jgi:hypothetical protein
MDEHTVDLTTPLGPVTATFSRGRLADIDVAIVNTGPGFAIGRHEYAGTIFLGSPGWTETAAHLLHDTTFTDANGKHPFPRDRAAIVSAIRAAVAGYAAKALVGE